AYSSNQTTFQADGAGSVINASVLATLTQQGYWDVTAMNGGEVDLPALVSLVNTVGSNGIVITDTGGSTIQDGSLASLDGVNVTLDGTGPQISAGWTSFTNGTITFSSGALSLSHLTNGTGSTITVTNGESITLANGTVTVPAGPQSGVTFSLPQV